MEEYIYTRNPWTDDDRSLGRIKDVLFLCEKTGHIDQDQSKEDSSQLTDEKDISASMKLITSLREMEESRKKMARTNLEIQRRLRDKETQDITHTDVLEKRAQKINLLNSHLQTLANQKDRLIGRLQQPYVGDFIKMDVHCKQYAAAIFDEMVPTLSALTSQLDNIEWIGKEGFSDEKLDRIMVEISSALASLELKHQTLMRVGGATRSFHTFTSPNTSSVYGSEIGHLPR